jgi:hypothetical protein
MFAFQRSQLLRAALGTMGDAGAYKYPPLAQDSPAVSKVQSVVGKLETTLASNTHDYVHWDI